MNANAAFNVSSASEGGAIQSGGQRESSNGSDLQQLTGHLPQIASISKSTNSSQFGRQPLSSSATTSASESTAIPNKPIYIPSPNSILVNPCQRGNPLLSFVRNVPWEYNSDVSGDYQVGLTAGALFLRCAYPQINHGVYIY